MHGQPRKRDPEEGAGAPDARAPSQLQAPAAEDAAKHVTQKLESEPGSMEILVSPLPNNGFSISDPTTQPQMHQGQLQLAQKQAQQVEDLENQLLDLHTQLKRSHKQYRDLEQEVRLGQEEQTRLNKAIRELMNSMT